jgi:hypothetical protein
MGIVFGVALEKSRVFDPGIIVGQMQLRNFIMIKVFLTAVGAVVLAILNGFDIVKWQPKAAIYAADIGGGLLLAWVSRLRACPGTTLAQIGAGYRDALFTLAGGILGAVVFSYLQPWFGTTVFSANYGNLTFTGISSIPYWAGALGFAAILLVLLALIERWRPWRDEMGHDFDGDLGALEPQSRPIQAVPAE